MPDAVQQIELVPCRELLSIAEKDKRSFFLNWAEDLCLWELCCFKSHRQCKPLYDIS